MFEEEFRREAVRLAESGTMPIAEVARQLGVHLETLRNRRRKARDAGGGESVTTVPSLEEENRRLRRENARLLEERGEGITIGREHVRTLMRRIGIMAIYQPPKTQRHPAHPVFPYLLRTLTVTRPNHVWAADITYIPMARGFVYLLVVMDWASRKVLSWRLSLTLTSDCCVAALEEPLTRYGCPAIFNTDQGSQFTSLEFLNVLRRREIRINMDCKGCWRDNVFVERLWRSVKYEEVYLHGYETVSDVRVGLTRYFQFFNQRRPPRGLCSRIPDSAYFTALPALRTPTPRAIPLIPAA